MIAFFYDSFVQVHGLSGALKFLVTLVIIIPKFVLNVFVAITGAKFLMCAQRAFLVTFTLARVSMNKRAFLYRYFAYGVATIATMFPCFGFL